MKKTSIDQNKNENEGAEILEQIKNSQEEFAVQQIAEQPTEFTEAEPATASIEEPEIPSAIDAAESNESGGVNSIPESEGITVPTSTVKKGVGYKIVTKRGFNSVDDYGNRYPEGLHLLDLRVPGRLFYLTIPEFEKYFHYSLIAKTPGNKWAELNDGVSVEEVIHDYDRLYKSAISYAVVSLNKGADEFEVIDELVRDYHRTRKEVLASLQENGYTFDTV